MWSQLVRATLSYRRTPFLLARFSAVPPKPPVVPVAPNDSQYQYWKDPRLRRVAQNIVVAILMLYASGMCTKYLISKYITEETVQMVRKEKKEEGVAGIKGGELQRAKVLKPEDLKNKYYFGKNRNFFIQLIPPSSDPPSALSPLYYQLKRIARKKSEPLYVYRIYLQDFDSSPQILASHFHIPSLSALAEYESIVINGDGMKLPILPRDKDQGVSAAIAYKFLLNPTRIDSVDDLYEAFDVNKGTNVKYVLVYNPGGQRHARLMTVQQKLFRKFFYENSNFLEPEVKFLEVTSAAVAQQVQLSVDGDEIMVAQNRNKYAKLKHGQDFNVLNLQLEKVVCEGLRQSELEKRYGRYLKDFSREEFEQEFLLSEDRIDEVFGVLAAFIEDALTRSDHNILFVQTLRMLKFYKTHFRARHQSLLFVQCAAE